MFELQFACEMKITDILKLTNRCNSNSDILFTSEPIKIAEAPKVESKGLKQIIGKSQVIQNIKKQIKTYASLKDIVLITGETGTGKELVAKAMHDEGQNYQEPFLAINCAALTDTLLQSELFGYVAGAFTGAQKEKKGIFEAAGKGTVFLDEFGDISPKLQATLLRVLETNEIRMLGGTVTRKIKCKIVIATNVDLPSAVEKRGFREDLFFRLAKFEIKLPALRERKGDLPELIQYFLDKNRGSIGNKKAISNDLFVALSDYQWPGNIRELKNEIDRLYILNPDVKLLDLNHFDFTHLQNFTISKIHPQVKIVKTDLWLKDNPEQEDPLYKIIQDGFPFEQRQATLKSLFVKYNRLTRKQIVEITKVCPSTATKDLLHLCNSGFIIRRSPTKSGRTDYFEIII
jgi:transcriptional regulator with PAS, ATPase and Fis domain